MIAIIDYGVGNVKAFANIYNTLDMPYIIAKSNKDLTKIKKIILPGVGAFDHAMQRLKASGMKEKLDELVLKDKLPTIGICVGMQMLSNKSDEGIEKGLGWIDAEINKFDRSKLAREYPLPHMGWNDLNLKESDELLVGLEQNPRFYFLHSYYFKPNNHKDIVATANYGAEFAAVVKSENVYGIQCHPEKSHHNGVRLLRNFGEI